MSAREWRSATERGARGERLVHVHEVERRGESTSSIVRATSTGGDGRPSAAPGERQQLADAEHAHAAVGRRTALRRLARRADQPPRLAHQLGRARRREHEHPVPARGELAGQLGARTR